MTDNMLTWNIRNWITVFLMFLLGWFLVMAGARLVVGKIGTGQNVGAYQSLVNMQTGSAGT